MRTATIKDVARRAGVSDATVSLVFSGHPRISEKTRQKVLAVARKMRYTPNLAARSLRQGGLKSIGFLVNDITDPFYALMIQSAETVAATRGYQLIFADSQWNPSKEIRAVENLIASRVKGMLLCLTEQTGQSLQFLTQAGLTLVAVDTCPPSFTGCLIGNDLVQTGRLAAEHLLARGCRNPVFVTAEEPMRQFSGYMAIQKGFRQVLRKRFGPEPASKHVVEGGRTINAGHAAFRRIRAMKPAVDGVLGANDLCALGVMRAADEAGVAVGRELAVMGIDDLEFSGLPRISLTSIRLPHADVAHLAATVLIDRLEKGTPLPARHLFPPRLMARKSTV